jgi:hypothetical protein
VERSLITETDGTWTEEFVLSQDEYDALVIALKNYRSDLEFERKRRSGKGRERAVLGIEIDWNDRDDRDAAQKEALSARVRGILAERMADLSLSDLHDLACCMEAIENDNGCATPAEDFITTIAYHHAMGGLTPGDAADQLEIFRRDFYDAATIHARFAERYARYVSAGACASPSDGDMVKAG